MTEAEQVLAELAEMICNRVGATHTECQMQDILRPYLPKPEPDRLTLAARECLKISDDWNGNPPAQICNIRAIIAREVAAVEPSDEAISRVHRLAPNGLIWDHKAIRAALKGEGK